MKKEKTHLVVCRSAFCPKCWQTDHPQKKDIFLIFRGGHQDFRFKEAHQDGLIGYTPHLYTVEFPFKRNKEGLVHITKTCLINHCGIEMGLVMQNGNFGFNILDVSEHWLTEKSVEALLTKWKGWTGYSLI